MRFLNRRIDRLADCYGSGPKLLRFRKKCMRLPRFRLYSSGDQTGQPMSEKPFSAVVRYLQRFADGAASDDVTDAALLSRFAAERDEAAFELLLWRHGAMVLRLCRDVTGDQEDAEDAFQAVFLSLARKAGSIRTGASVGAWLHRTAHRAALRARVLGKVNKLQIDHGCDVTELAAPAGPADANGQRELRALIHEEKCSGFRQSIADLSSSVFSRANTRGGGARARGPRAPSPDGWRAECCFVDDFRCAA